VRIGEGRNGDGRETEQAGGREASSNGAGPAAAGQRAASAPGGGTTVAAPPAVNVRLAVDGIETLDSGSLVLTVHDTPVSVPADGFVELALEPGVPHRIVATGRRKGQLVRAELTTTPTLDDENAPLLISLM
jgi:hypothetical protein